jgi:ABC-type Mn2+/Zn2+ transport system permease subunit
MTFINAILEYDFLQRALVVGLLVSISLSLLGINLVLKKFSNIGDGLSHVSFGTLAVALAFNIAPLQFSIPIVVLAAFVLLRIGENSKIKGDAAIALVSSVAVAIGIIAVSLNGGVNIDIDSFMFGSILSISKSDFLISVIISLSVIIIYALFYHKIFAITFDEEFAKAVGLNIDLYKLLLSIMTALTIVIGIRMIGTLLISSLIIFPTLTSMMIGDNFKKVIIGSLIVSIISFFAGFTASYYMSTPIGASIVISHLIIFIMMYIYSKIRLVFQKI